MNCSVFHLYVPAPFKPTLAPFSCACRLEYDINFLKWLTNTTKARLRFPELGSTDIFSTDPSAGLKGAFVRTTGRDKQQQ